MVCEQKNVEVVTALSMRGDVELPKRVQKKFLLTVDDQVAALKPPSRKKSARK